ncbi:hypothetical protein MRB53_025994 [Persea americana]|uniref:Uncharacterized protein n=1 Tax=Persea americana TaxID=3435 RepID=A0ACC2LHL4_PERAE|nr:hypothetical protein MRB53_025994 [Persea americana]
MPCPAVSDAGTADVASVHDTVVTATPEVAAELYTEELEQVAVAAREIRIEELSPPKGMRLVEMPLKHLHNLGLQLCLGLSGSLILPR